MKTRMGFLLLLAHFILATSARAEKDNLLFYLECPPTDSNCRTFPTDDGTISVRAIPDLVVGENDLVSASTYDEGQREAMLRIDLTPEATKTFWEMTKKSINKRIAIVVNEQVLIAPVVKQEIPGGSLQIARMKSLKAVPWLEKKIQDVSDQKAQHSQRMIWTYITTASILLLAAVLFVFAPLLKKRTKIEVA